MTNRLKTGDKSEAVSRLQLYLYRISGSIAQIPKIGKIDGVFGKKTENAVRSFKSLYSLGDGAYVDEPTYNKIYEVFSFFSRIERICDLSLGIPKQYRGELSLGKRGSNVAAVQCFLSLIREFIPCIPAVKMNGVYEEETVRAVAVFQRERALPITGEVDFLTMERLYKVYRGIMDFAGKNHMLTEKNLKPLPEINLTRGSLGPAVRIFKGYLSFISAGVSLPDFEMNNAFDFQTQKALREFQRIFSLPQNGLVDEATRQRLRSVYRIVEVGRKRLHRQYPGYPVREKCRDSQAVFEVQTALYKLSLRYDDMPIVYPDGIYGEETKNAVAAYERRLGVDITGEVGFEVWNKLMSGPPPTRQASP